MAATYDGIVAAVQVLDRTGLSGDMELHLDGEAAELLVRDRELQDRLLAPTRMNMTPRIGFAMVGCLRIGERCVRIYERLI